ncbi:restriction endonuclease subunit S [Priestia aryabhattai]|uniref:restriction endonuclease subunit S n=1 Tax=Priestia aryabhattai TaxID=412384 RepID=UPI003CEE4610
MRSNWKIESLGNYISQQSTRNRGLENIEVYSVTNSNGFTKSTEYFKKEVFSKNLSNYKIVTRNQFAYNPSRINVGSIAFLSDADFALVSPLYIIFEVDKDHLFPDYLLRYLKSNYGNVQIRNNTEGSVRDSLKYKGLEKIKIPIPPLNDQIRIVTVLTLVEGLIAKRKESTKLLDELLKSTFLEMFGDPVRNEKGWEKETLRNLSIKFSDGPFGSNLKTSHYEKTGVRVIRLNNIGSNKFINDNKAFISQKHFDEVLKKYECFPGDVVIGTLGNPNIRACIIPDYIEVAVNKADCILCRPNKNKALPEYINGIINLPSFLSLASNLFHGQTRTRVSMGQLAKLEIPLPPLSLQNQFAAIVEKIESLKAKNNQSLIELENLYGSLSQRSFKGEIDLSKVPVEVENEIIELQKVEKGIPSVGSELVESNIYSEAELIKIIHSQEGETFSFDSLMTALEKASFEEMPEYEEIKVQIYRMLEGTNPLLSQTFDKIKKEVRLRINT